MTEPTQTKFWQRFFGGPSKELAEARAAAYGVQHSARLLKISAAQLEIKAQEIAEIAKFLSTGPGKQ